MVTRTRLLAFLFASLAPFACAPEFNDRTSQVVSARLLAVQSEPAEWVKVVDPDTGLAKAATFRALVVGPQGGIPDAALDWAFCNEPKPLTELNDVSIKCFSNDPSFIVPVGNGPQVSAAISDDTCRNFGPDVPLDTSFRPADPDVTGGYYQPLRVNYAPGGTDLFVPNIAKIRIRCGLPGASQEQTALYNRNYHLNTNPSIDSITALLPSGPQVVMSTDVVPRPDPLPVAAGQTITLRVAWPVCPVTDTCGDGVCGPTETSQTGDGNCTADCQVDRGCGGAERFLAFSLATRTLDTDREVFRASWYAIAGSFRDDRTGRDATDLATTTDNDYTAPTVPGVYPLWVVLRDNRGGTTWKNIEIRVQ